MSWADQVEDEVEAQGGEVAGDVEGESANNLDTSLAGVAVDQLQGNF